METPRVRLGELLVRAGLVTNEQLEEALLEQRRVGKRLGSLLVDSGLVSETQVTQILSQQLSVPWVSLHHIDFSRDLLNLVPVDVVEKYCLIPIYVRRVRGLGDALYIAMDDPTNGQALSAVAERSGLHVRAMIAPPSDIRGAIRVYYGVGAPPVPAPVAPPQVVTPVAPPDQHTEPAERPEQVEKAKAEDEEDEDVPTGIHSRQALFAGAAAAAASEASTVDAVAAPVAPAPVAPAPAPQPVAAPPPAPTSSPRASSAPPESRPRPRFDSAPPSSRGTRDFTTGKAAGERAVKAPQKPGARKMIALTLLDGTTISVPAKEKKGAATVEEPPEEVRAAPGAAEPGGEVQLTARDIVAALRAAARGVDASEIIGENARWEAMFAALLSALLKKHLITDREFIEEFKKS